MGRDDGGEQGAIEEGKASRDEEETMQIVRIKAIVAAESGTGEVREGEA